MSNIKLGGKFTLIFDEQNAATLDKYSVDFRDVNVAIAYDDARDDVCVSVWDRENSVMRYYNIVKGELKLVETEEN